MRLILPDAEVVVLKVADKVLQFRGKRHSLRVDCLKISDDIYSAVYTL